MSFVSWSREAWHRIENEVSPGTRDRLRSPARDRSELNESYGIIRPLAAPGAEVRLSAAAWANYFPALPVADLCRVPDMLADGTAWPHYAESIDEFIGAAVSLRDLLPSLRETRKRGFDASSGLFFLEELLHPVRRTLRVGAHGVLEPTWALPSLIGNLGAIEIKPLNKRRYSYHELCKVIDEQLTGQYMQPREVSFGVLLLVYHERRHWTIAKKSCFAKIRSTAPISSW